jgi:hypothetical protein
MYLLRLSKHWRLLLIELLAITHLHRMENVGTHTEILVLIGLNGKLKIHWIYRRVPTWIRTDTLMFHLCLEISDKSRFNLLFHFATYAVLILVGHHCYFGYKSDHC